MPQTFLSMLKFWNKLKCLNSKRKWSLEKIIALLGNHEFPQ